MAVSPLGKGIEGADFNPEAKKKHEDKWRKDRDVQNRGRPDSPVQRALGRSRKSKKNI